MKRQGDKPVSLVVVGAGNRGYYTYGAFALKHPNMYRVVAVAEPDADKREKFARTHDLPENMVFETWEDILNKPKFADAVVIATSDDQHVEPTIAFAKAGYHVLLEKPVARKPEEFARIYNQTKDCDVIILVAHVLRYTPFFKKLKDIVDSGRIGDIKGIDHEEHVGYFHFAHSFVRGNWRRSDETAPSILTKCCHDMDIMVWLIGSFVDTLTAHGNLLFFTGTNKPKEASDRCIDCPFENTCVFSATRIYLGDNTGWPVNAISVDLSYEGRYRAVKEGPYGRCVFACDNDVCDYYAVSMSFKSGVLGTFTMTGLSAEITRKIRLFGTLGEIEGDFASGRISVKLYGKTREEYIEKGEEGHSGGDEGLLNHFYKVLKGCEEPQTTLSDSLESHYMAFAIEESRLCGGKPVNVTEFRKRYEGSEF
ncbi:MAG: Gfo/Idh/MocA family oxidoreductase [Thermotogae bacterium]|nr:Gfo/Idh/MocA family oxidoreductase [Thermotogota bacterium]